MRPLRPCLDCGTPTRHGTRCPDHQQAFDRARNARRPQYRGGWARLSRQARAEQPWCSVCGATTDLTLDHEHSQVECRPCNSRHRGTTVPT